MICRECNLVQINGMAEEPTLLPGEQSQNASYDDGQRGGSQANSLKRVLVAIIPNGSD